MGISIADSQYAGALVRGLGRECRNMSFLMGEPDAADLILTDAPFPEEYQKDRYVYLVPRDEDTGDRPDLIFRYEDCRIMVNRMTYINYLRTGRNLSFRGTSVFRTVSFVSSEGGVGVTSLCISAGRMLSILYGGHCLYVTLTPLDGAGRYMGAVSGADLQKMFYHLEEKREVPMDSYIVSDGYLDRLRTPRINHYMTEIDGTILSAMMAAINDMGQYDFVLVDIGAMYAGGALELLRNSDAIVYVEDGRRPGGEEIMEEVARILGLTEINGIRVTNMVRERGESNAEEVRVCLCRQAFQRESGQIMIDLNSAYGADVAVLCERMMGI